MSQQAIKTIAAISETIRELKEVPNGHLYARIMGTLSLDQYNQVIAILVRAKLVANKNDLLVWIGPTF